MYTCSCTLYSVTVYRIGILYVYSVFMYSCTIVPGCSLSKTRIFNANRNCKFSGATGWYHHVLHRDSKRLWKRVRLYPAWVLVGDCNYNDSRLRRPLSRVSDCMLLPSLEVEVLFLILEKILIQYYQYWYQNQHFLISRYEIVDKQYYLLVVVELKKKFHAPTIS